MPPLTTDITSGLSSTLTGDAEAAEPAPEEGQGVYTDDVYAPDVYVTGD